MNEKLRKKVSPRRGGAGSPSKLISRHIFFLSYMARYLSTTRMNQKSICYNDWEIPLPLKRDRDDKFFECMREGRSGDSTEISQKY